MLNKGQGCDPDESKAASWFERAATQGLVEAQIALGDAYRSGRGVSADEAVARQWYEKAARQGNETATKRLAQSV